MIERDVTKYLKANKNKSSTNHTKIIDDIGRLKGEMEDIR